jgi:hypothetical protein
MRSRVRTAFCLAITLPAAATMAGCEKSPRDRLQGRWLGESIENVPTAQLPKATGWVKGTAIEFNGAKVTVTIPAETPRTGSYKVTRKEGDTYLVSFAREEGGHDEAEMSLVGDGQLRWKIGEGREIVMGKARN